MAHQTHIFIFKIFKLFETRTHSHTHIHTHEHALCVYFLHNYLPHYAANNKTVSILTILDNPIALNINLEKDAIIVLRTK